jgi:hypothetical protein
VKEIAGLERKKKKEKPKKTNTHTHTKEGQKKTVNQDLEIG